MCRLSVTCIAFNSLFNFYLIFSDSSVNILFYVRVNTVLCHWSFVRHVTLIRISPRNYCTFFSLLTVACYFLLELCIITKMSSAISFVSESCRSMYTALCKQCVSWWEKAENSVTTEQLFFLVDFFWHFWSLRLNKADVSDSRAHDIYIVYTLSFILCIYHSISDIACNLVYDDCLHCTSRCD